MSDPFTICPQCGSRLVRFRPNRDDWLCDHCDHRWTAADRAVPPRGARLFLSYGRRDALELAKRLRADLEGRGHQVWQDAEQIRPGKEWELEIQDGLRSTQLVVALLSPHAVRRGGDAGNPDDLDSVCLDEISFARFARPSRPIVPVMAVPCEPPLCIFRLDYVDLCAWRNSEDQYRSGFERLLKAIDAALRGELHYRRWDHRLRPWDFAAFLNEKRRDFCGRQWLFDEMDAWRASCQEGALLITGDPGVGKSAIVAELVHRNPGGQVLAYHCCQADAPETLRPDRFVRSLAAMIASRLGSYAARLDDPAVAEALAEGNCARDPGSAFEAGVLAPLEVLTAPAEGVRYILVDALDEALALREGQTIVEMLASRLERLPAWLRLVATTRKERAVLDRLRGLRAREVCAQDPRNLADVDAYVLARLHAPNLAERLVQAGRTPREVARLLGEKSEGNFLYAQQALQGLERDLSPLDELQTLPPGLNGLYLRFFSRNFPDEPAYAPVRAVLEVLVAAREPLREAELTGATGLDGETEIPRALRLLSGYLSEREDGHVLYHKSLADWLTDPSQRGGRYAVSSRLGHRRLTAFLERAYASAPERMPPFALAHLLYHATCAGQESLVRELLADASHLTLRVVAAGPGALIADLNLIPHRLPALESQAMELVQVLSRRNSLLEQVPAQTAQELANQALAPASATRTDSRPPPPLQGRKAPVRPLTRIAGPTDRQAVSLPSVVVSIGVTEDGRAMVSTGSPPNGLRIWRMPGGEPAACLLGHRAGVAEACFLPDGDQLLSGSWDHRVILWDVRTARMLATFPSHDDVVNAVAASPNGRLGASAGWDGRIAVYDLPNRTALGILAEGEGQLNSLRFSPNGSRLLCGGGEGRVTLWDVPGRRLLRTWAVSGGGLLNCLDVDWSAGRVVAATLGGRLYLLALDGEGIVATGQLDEVPLERVVLLPGRGLAATGDGDGRLRLWQLPDLRPREWIQAHQGRLPALAVSGQTMVSGGGDQCLRAWDLPSLRLLWSVETARDVLMRAELSADGCSWWGSNRRGKVLQGRVGQPGAIVDAPAELGPAYAVHSRSADFVAVGSTKGVVACRDASGWRWLQRPHHSAVAQLAASTRGDLLASLDMQGELCVLDRATGRLRLRLRTGPNTAGLCWGKREGLLFWLDGDGRLCSLDLITGGGARVLFQGLVRAQGLVVVEEAGLAATACETGPDSRNPFATACGTQIRVVEWESGSAAPIDFHFPMGVQRLLRLPDRTEAIALGGDGVVAWLDLAARELRAATQLPSTPLAAAFSPPGGLVLLDTAGRDYRFE